MKKLVIVAAVIVMAGSMISCGQKTQKAAEATATEPVVTEQVEAVEIEAVNPEAEIPAAAESQQIQPEQAK